MATGSRLGQTSDDAWMDRALDLAQRGLGRVEPNPLVGCVLVRDGEAVGEGWHQRFGGPHAEIEAFRDAGDRVPGCTMYVTLEPCCHQGKTPPCTEAIIGAGVRRVVVAAADPFPAVAGEGIRRLQHAGLQVDVGCRQQAAESLNAPYLHRVRTGRPWLIGKWAMTLDGRVATDSGQSQWISGPVARQRVHELRGRIDAIVVGMGTVWTDDPRLTARPPGPRIATRVVLSSRGDFPAEAQLWRTLDEAPLLVVVDDVACPADRRAELRHRGAEVLAVQELRGPQGLCQLAEEFGRRQMTNILVEGGRHVLGSFFRADLLQELHVFIAPRLIAGTRPAGPLAAESTGELNSALRWETTSLEQVGDDLHWQLRRRK